MKGNEQLDLSKQKQVGDSMEEATERTAGKEGKKSDLFILRKNKGDIKYHRSSSASSTSSRRPHRSSVSSASLIEGKLLEAGTKAATLKVKRKQALKAAEEELDLQ